MPDETAAAAVLRAHVEALWSAGIRDGAAYERLAAQIIDGIYAVPDGAARPAVTA